MFVTASCIVPCMETIWHFSVENLVFTNGAVADIRRLIYSVHSAESGKEGARSRKS